MQGAGRGLPRTGYCVAHLWSAEEDMLSSRGGALQAGSLPSEQVGRAQAGGAFHVLWVLLHVTSAP